MSETKFTPGPWTFNTEDSGCRPISAADGTGVCATDGRWHETEADGYEDSEDLANAHLIATAPKLYDVLDRLIDAAPDSVEYYRARVDAVSVLAEARGESPTLEDLQRSGNTSDSEGMANARLVSASPDLYEALTEWNGITVPMTAKEFARKITKTRAALAKARGESFVPETHDDSSQRGKVRG